MGGGEAVWFMGKLIYEDETFSLVTALCFGPTFDFGFSLPANVLLVAQEMRDVVKCIATSPLAAIRATFLRV
jgi:hypothetical protein